MQLKFSPQILRRLSLAPALLRVYFCPTSLSHRHDPLRVPVWAFHSHPISSPPFHLISNSRRVSILVPNPSFHPSSFLPSFDSASTLLGISTLYTAPFIAEAINPFQLYNKHHNPLFYSEKKEKKRKRERKKRDGSRNSHLSLKFSTFHTFTLGSSSRFVFLIAATGMERVSSLLISKGLFNKLLRPRRKTLEVARNLDNNARFGDNYQSPLIVPRLLLSLSLFLYWRSSP